MIDSNDKQYILDRADAVPAIIGAHKDFLIITGLAGASQELAHLTNDADHLFTMAGAMGAACATGLGLALAQPNRKVLVVTGDGELLMNIGSLATIAVLNPPNLSILCVDNGHYGETGYQKSHTSLGVDLETIAQGSAIKATRTVQTEGEIADGARVLRESNATSFVVLRVKPTNPPKIKRNLRASECRARFRLALL